MATPFLGESVGTTVLIIFGNGVVANSLLKGSNAEGAGYKRRLNANSEALIR